MHTRFFKQQWGKAGNKESMQSYNCTNWSISLCLTHVLICHFRFSGSERNYDSPEDQSDPSRPWQLLRPGLLCRRVPTHLFSCFLHNYDLFDSCPLYSRVVMVLLTKRVARHWRQQKVDRDGGGNWRSSFSLGNFCWSCYIESVSRHQNIPNGCVWLGNGVARKLSKWKLSIQKMYHEGRQFEIG